MKVAIVHDWFVTYSGAEKVVEKIIEIFPESDIFCLVDFLPKEYRRFLRNKKIWASLIQKLPKSRTYFRHYFPLFRFAIEQHNLSAYDLIISSSHCVAKGVKTEPHQLHICYCHSPARYAWDLQDHYLDLHSINGKIRRKIVRRILSNFRCWDYKSSKSVDYFIVNSKYISNRVERAYSRESKVIYPNVDVDDFELSLQKSNYYVTCSRLVSYKRVDVIVEAFSKLPEKKLLVVGSGPEYDTLKNMAANNVTILGRLSFSELKMILKKARAFVFAADEDFGIAPVEAMACGTPVIAYGKGGLLETVIDKKTGIFFYEQTAESIIKAIFEFENTKLLSADKIREHAYKFSSERFVEEFSQFVQQCWTQHCSSYSVQSVVNNVLSVSE